MAEIADRVAGLDWSRIGADLDRWGAATTGPLLSVAECRSLTALYPDDRRFRSTVTMARHGFGRGEYRYFGYPLPDLVGDLRAALYPRLAALANAWAGRTGDDDLVEPDIVEEVRRGEQHLGLAVALNDLGAGVRARTRFQKTIGPSTYRVVERRVRERELVAGEKVILVLLLPTSRLAELIVREGLP